MARRSARTLYCCVGTCFAPSTHPVAHQYQALSHPALTKTHHPGPQAASMRMSVPASLHCPRPCQKQYRADGCGVRNPAAQKSKKEKKSEKSKKKEKRREEEETKKLKSTEEKPPKRKIIRIAREGENQGGCSNHQSTLLVTREVSRQLWPF
jgi:hypothetical protein